MKVLLPSLAALALLATPVHAQKSPPAAPAEAATSAPAKADSASTPATPPPRISRWEDAGMTPAEAREWQNYAFKPEQGVEWKKAGFTALVARTWADKGFDAEEAREWRDSRKINQTLMADLDQSEPIQWKREGLTPQDRLAWWEAGFTFDDAILLVRAGMGPAEAAWHGHDKLKELKGQSDTHGSGSGSAAPGSLTDTQDLQQQALKVWAIIGPYLQTGLIAVVAFLAGGVFFYLLFRGRIGSARNQGSSEAPDSEMPTSPTPSAGTAAKGATKAATRTAEGAPNVRRRPARRLALTHDDTPHCLYCKSTNVRPSRMRPHRFAGIHFTNYFRCKQCGKHFAIVNYMPIIAAGSTVVLLLTIVTSSFIYMLSLIH